MDTIAPPLPPVAQAPAHVEAVAAVTQEARLARLFRHTLRQGGVNPLMHLVPRWRERDKS